MNIIKLLKSNNVVNSAFWYIIGSFILKGVNFFTVPIFTSLLTPGDMGKISIYATWISIFAILVGIGVEGTVGSAKANLKYDEYREYLSSSLFLSTIVFVIIFFNGIIFKNQLANIMGIDIKLIMLLIIQSFFNFVISFVLVTYTFDRNYKMYLLISFLATGLNIILSISIILNLESDKYIGRILGWAISTIGIGLILYIKVILQGKKLISKKLWIFCLPIALPLIFHNLSHLLLNQADILMLKKYTNDSIVGIYGVLYMIGSIINIIQNAINGAWIPMYYEILKSGDEEGLRKKSGIYIVVFTLITTVFMLGVPEIIKIFTDKVYWNYTSLVYVIIVGYYFVYLYTFSANFQFYMKETKFIALGTITAAISNIVLNYFTIRYIGIYGAAVSTLVSYILLFLIHFFIVKYKFNHRDFPFKYNISGIICIFIIWVISYILIDYIVIRWLMILFILSLFLIKVYLEIKKYKVN